MGINLKTFNMKIRKDSTQPFIDVGLLGAVTDKELTMPDVAADAKATGDTINDLQNEINGKINEEVSTRAAADTMINTRIDNIIAQAGTDNTEVVDARVGTDSTQYTVLKNRLDAENTQLKSQIDWYTRPEYFGAKADGVTDDTAAFVSAMATGLDVIATGTYKVGALTVGNAHISGKGIGTIICDSITIEPDAVVEELNIECSGKNAFIVDTTSKPTNTTVYNSFVRHCTVTCAADGSMAFFNLLNGKGVSAVTFDDITVKCAGNGHSVFRIHTEQTAASRPWISPAMFLNIMAVEDPFQYFIYIDDPVMTGGTYSGSFFKFIIENCHFQYYSGVTQYCGYLRGVKNTIININTYDFPAADPIYYFSALDSSVRLTAIPLDHGNLMTAIDGVTGYERNVFYLETALYHAGYSNFRPEVYDSYTDFGTYAPYNMPTMFPVAFTDESNSHKLNGIAIPQSKALYDGTRGSAVFANDNSNNQPVFWVYSTSGTWIKHTLMTDRNCPRGTTAERPSSVSIGYMYYDTTLHKPIWWSGINNAWRDATGAAV